MSNKVTALVIINGGHLGLSFSSPWNLKHTLLLTNIASHCGVNFEVLSCWHWQNSTITLQCCSVQDLTFTLQLTLPGSTLTRKRCWFRRRRLRTRCFAGAGSPWMSASSPWLWSVRSAPDSAAPPGRCWPARRRRLSSTPAWSLLHRATAQGEIKYAVCL